MADNYNGRSYLLYAATSTPANPSQVTNYDQVGLLVNLQFNRSRNLIEKSNKDDGAYSSWLAGRRVESVSGSAIFDHTADTGQAHFQTAYEASNGTIYWLITSTDTTQDEFYGEGVVTNYTFTFNDEEPSQIEFEIQSTGSSTHANGDNT